MKKTNDHYPQLKKFSLEKGFDLFGVADITEVKKEFALSQEVIKGMDRAVSVAVRLSSGILEEIIDAPTRLYFHHYRCANTFLDQAAFQLSQYIQRKGYRALPIPASQIVDWQKQSAHLSHKKVAVLAGLGWLGRNNLVVNKKLGAQFRLATILTDMPLKADKPAADTCGNCRACVAACPAGAIKENAIGFDHQRCFEKLKDFQKQRLVDQFICGVCVTNCKGK